MPDDNQYPTEDELEKIARWDAFTRAGQIAWFVFIKSCWWAEDWGWRERAARGAAETAGPRIYEIATGGWSGNESIISAMQQNHVLWMFTWELSRRGGHYLFRVREVKIRVPTIPEKEGQPQ